MNKRTVLLIPILALAAHAGTAYDGSFSSTILGKTTRYKVFRPTNYDAEVAKGTRYPVVYLLHWLDGTTADWNGGSESNGLDIASIIDGYKLIAVAPSDQECCTNQSWWMDASAKPTQKVATYLATELKKEIDSRYATYKDRDNTGLAGVSMGGYGALRNTILFDSVYSACFSMAGCVDFLNANGSEPALSNCSAGDPLMLCSLIGTNLVNWRKQDVLHNAGDFTKRAFAIRISIGADDDFLAGNRRLHQKLDSLHVTHTYTEIANREHSYPTTTEMKAALLFFQNSFKYGPTSIPKPAKRKEALRSQDRLTMYRCLVLHRKKESGVTVQGRVERSSTGVAGVLLRWPQR